MMAFGAKAQEGEIIYTDYGPDGWSHQFQCVYSIGYVAEEIALEIDLDNDSIIDLYYWGLEDAGPYQGYLPGYSSAELHSTWSVDGGWYCHFINKTTGVHTFFDAYGDTISIINEYGEELPTWWPDQYFSFQHGVWEDDVERPNPRYIAFRNAVDEGYCYGWLEHSIEFTKYPCNEGSYTYYHLGTVRVYRWAYCTVPNYPLRVGQTSFDWDVAENEANYFASIHPNPTSGLVTITGKDLKQAEVFNALGQCVATAQGEGERLTVDISALPAGIYLVNVTDEDGKKCVRKVVKQ